MTKSLRDIVTILQEKNIETTLLGIGPMSEIVIRATLELARDMQFPVMFIASRNQIDSANLGGGYVMGWDQMAFSNAIHNIAGNVGFEGLLYLCRDHGGPWQRDNERNEKLPLKEAMEKAKSSYLDDLKAGFNLLHIDPTKDPHIQGPVPMDLVIERNIELISYLEEQIQKLNLAEVSYEVGTEETAGGLISNDAFSTFIEKLLKELDSRSLPHPAFIVGQTGTLVKMNKNVGNFDPETAHNLSMIARKYGLGFKEHNADYLSEDILRLHPKLGITSANVAPEFGLEETKALLDLADKEEEKLKSNPNRKSSEFRKIIQKSALNSGRWKKWLFKEDAYLTEKDIANMPEKLDEITIVCGHYVFDQPDVQSAREKLYKNLIDLNITDSPERILIDSVKNSIVKYVNAFNLKELNSVL
ncbi:MAG: class II D-tagatose-bisphosphate aldolase non-catalytic subunit [Candidatus Poribacteria bacterium]